MEFSDLNNLIRSGKAALALHALQEWEKDFSSHTEPLIHALKSADAGVIEKALQLAAKYHPQACVECIAGLLRNEDALLRRLAVQALAPAMGKPAADALKGLFPEEHDVFVLASAVTAAARLKIGLEYIRPYLGYQDIRLRANSVRAAAILGRHLLPGLLEPFLQDPALRVQNEALKGLATLAPESDLEKLVLKRLNSPDAATRAATVFATGELPLSRKTVLQINALSDSDSRVACCAIRALAMLRDPLGVRAIIECFLASQDENLARQALKHLRNDDAGRIIAFADNLARPAAANQVLITRVILAAETLSNWEPFLPWILAGANRKEDVIRLQALRFIAREIDFFRSNIGPLVEKAECSGQPADIAIAALIRWKSGQTEGLARLKSMIYSLKPAESRAACEILAGEKNLIARNLLEEARLRGVFSDAVKTDGAQHLKLPGA